MEMFLDQAVNMDLVLCPTLSQVGMREQAEEEGQVSKKKKFREIFFKLFRNSTSSQTISKDINSKSVPNFLHHSPPLKKTEK